jgi:hypothetical protein
MSSTPVAPTDLLDVSSKSGGDLWVSAVTPSLLVALVVQHRCGHWTEALGQWSESLFQGVQLPVLDFPELEQPEN